MAIAIPLIGGVREAANNAKCRSNLKQLHTAIIAFSTSNKERLPNLQSDLQPLIDGGYIESESKLGICPGAGAKPELPNSSYAGGPDLDGTKKLSSAGINSETVILADADKDYHKVGRNAIRLDGSFTQGLSGGGDPIIVDPIITPPPAWWEQIEQNVAITSATIYLLNGGTVFFFDGTWKDSGYAPYDPSTAGGTPNHNQASTVYPGQKKLTWDAQTHQWTIHPHTIADLVQSADQGNDAFFRIILQSGDVPVDSLNGAVPIPHHVIGTSPVHALMRRHLIFALVQAGWDLSIVYNGKTPLEYARQVRPAETQLHGLLP